MIIIKDAMVVIHLAKMTLLETSCDYFKDVFMPEQVKDEILNVKYDDIKVIEALIKNNKIKVKNVKNKQLVQKANEFNIHQAEAEAVALYWEINADFIATDDDNVRKKKDILKLNVIGTPAILLKLYNEKKIEKTKLNEAIKKLKEIGWFSNTVWDKIRLEVENA